MWLAALTGSESGGLGLRGVIVELDVGAAGETGWAGGSAVDFCCEDGVDEGVYCGVALDDGLPSLGGGESVAVTVEAGDFLLGFLWAGHLFAGVSCYWGCGFAL